MRKKFVLPVMLTLALCRPATASADITAFFGVNPTPSNRVLTGFSGGIGLLIVAFEFEYANTVQDLDQLAPGLKTFMMNGLLQTPVPIGGVQFYATGGGGVFRESIEDLTETNVGWNIGGGIKMNLAGPLRLRLDYRVFNLTGNDVRHSKPHRFYAGLNLNF